MRKQKGLNGRSLLSEFLPETGHIYAERVVIKLAFLQKIESSKPILIATIMTSYPKGSVLSVDTLAIFLLLFIFTINN